MPGDDLLSPQEQRLPLASRLKLQQTREASREASRDPFTGQPTHPTTGAAGAEHTRELSRNPFTGQPTDPKKMQPAARTEAVREQHRDPETGVQHGKVAMVGPQTPHDVQKYHQQRLVAEALENPRMGLGDLTPDNAELVKIIRQKDTARGQRAGSLAAGQIHQKGFGKVTGMEGEALQASGDPGFQPGMSEGDQMAMLAEMGVPVDRLVGLGLGALVPGLAGKFGSGQALRGLAQGMRRAGSSEFEVPAAMRSAEDVARVKPPQGEPIGETGKPPEASTKTPKGRAQRQAEQQAKQEFNAKTQGPGTAPKTPRTRTPKKAAPQATKPEDLASKLKESIERDAAKKKPPDAPPKGDGGAAKPKTPKPTTPKGDAGKPRRRPADKGLSDEALAKRDAMEKKNLEANREVLKRDRPGTQGNPLRDRLNKLIANMRGDKSFQVKEAARRVISEQLTKAYNAGQIDTDELRRWMRRGGMGEP